MITSGMFRVHVGDTMSTSGDVQYIGGYHEYIENIMFSTLGDVQCTEVFNRN